MAVSDGLLCGSECEEGFCSEFFSQFGNVVVEFVVGNHVAEQPLVGGRLGVEPSSEIDHPACGFVTEESGKTLTATPTRHDTEGDLGAADHRRFTRYSQITGEQYLESTAERVTVDGRDSNAGKVCQRITDAVSQATPVVGLLCRQVHHVFDVGSGDEAFVGTRNDENACVASGVLDRLR